MSINDIHQLFQKFSIIPEEKKKINKYSQKPFKVFYKIFISKYRRNKNLEKAETIHQIHLADCWKKTIDVYHQHKLPRIDIKAKKKFSHQKIIWQYWGQGIDASMPEIVTLCFNSVDKYKENYLVIRLDDNSIHEYLDFPDFIWEKRRNPEFRHVFFSDLLRLALLYNYGGIWIDATILLTDAIDDNIANQDFFVFQRDDLAENKQFWQNYNPEYFSWDKLRHINMLTSFMVAKRDSDIIYDLLQLLLYFWKTQNTIMHYFFFQILFDSLKRHPKYISIRQLKIIDDTLPHVLISKIAQPFNEKQFQDIRKKTSIHKLTYINTNNLKENSYYHYLKKYYYNEK